MIILVMGTPVDYSGDEYTADFGPWCISTNVISSKGVTIDRLLNDVMSYDEYLNLPSFGIKAYPGSLYAGQHKG